ncbi:hypothetical protein CCMA1212_005692 [Trichoderma ghanense]|uniref:Uncharacterized protein n=1 Tax=Trichoderma ghanense TaxID=65468 RepID=A0ABY2H1M0_9HYPO
MEGNKQSHRLTAILAAAGARYRITRPCDKAFAATYSISQMRFRIWYAREGCPVILLPIWVISACLD